MAWTRCPSPIALFLLGLFAVLGCQGNHLFSRNDDPYDKSQYGPSPQERIEQLRQLSADAPRMDTGQQQRTAELLYRDMQQEGSPVLRLYQVRALARLPVPAANEALSAAVRDPDPEVRAAACRAWGDRPGPEALRVLSEVLGSDSEIDVRLAATRALGQMGNQQAVSSLAIALDDPDPALQRRAMESLKGVSGEDFGNDVVAWQQYVRGENPTPRLRQETLADRWLPWR